jgi:hypothetical protein
MGGKKRRVGGRGKEEGARFFLPKFSHREYGIKLCKLLK